MHKGWQDSFLRPGAKGGHRVQLPRRHNAILAVLKSSRGEREYGISEIL